VSQRLEGISANRCSPFKGIVLRLLLARFLIAKSNAFVRNEAENSKIRRLAELAGFFD